MWAVVKNSEVILPFLLWSPRLLSARVSEYGINVSLPTAEPSAPIIWPIYTVGLYPVTVVDIPIPPDKKRNGESIEFDGDRVIVTPIIIDKTPKELEDEEKAKIVSNRDGDENQENLIKQWNLENKYLEATKALIELSGTVIEKDEWPKLEDVEFERVAEIAAKKDAAVVSVLLSTLLYTFFQLKILGVSWESIEYHEQT